MSGDGERWDAPEGAAGGMSAGAGGMSAGAGDDAGSMSAAARRSYADEAILRKDHVSAGLLAVFLGMFGVHKFYLGCNNAGFIMLAVSIIGGICTFGLAAAVMWLIAVIEGVIYLTKSQTAFERAYVLNRRDWF